MDRLQTYYHTLKYLKLSQVVQRIRKRFLRPDISSFTPNVELSERQGVWNGLEFGSARLLTETDVEFLNSKGRVQLAEDWNAPNRAKLWLYNLHYFDDLNSKDAESRREVQFEWIERWIQDNPVGYGNGWEPYPTSLRIVNWVKAFLSGLNPTHKMLTSLSSQAEYLSKDLEYHLLGNHLFANAKALIFAGCFFQGVDAERWWCMGLKILRRELDEQLLEDGGNFELTPMYHALMLHDILDIINLSQIYSTKFDVKRVAYWRQCAQKMLPWLDMMSHPDGDIAFFNDAATGVAPNFAQLNRYAERLGVCADLTKRRANYLADSGYICISDEDLDLLVDVARVGPDYIPGHAHADTLSFELSLYKQRVFVNSGTSEYGLTDERLRQRKTAAHNTVEVDGEDSSEVWSGFRVARRAYPKNITLHTEDGVVNVSACHSGYLRLPGKVNHQRSWQQSSGRLLVVDSILGQFTQARAYLHLHPLVKIVSQTPGECGLVLESGHRISVNVRGGTLSVEPSTWHPEFGRVVPSQRLVITLVGDRLETEVLYSA